MGLERLNSLYREVILDHSDHPHHKHALPDATHKITLKKPDLRRCDQSGY